jgi:large subunit ribosomal protein L17
MKHQNGYRKLGVEGSHRKAMLRNLATSFMLEGQIKTTIARAKEARRIIEKLITLASDNSFNAKKRAARLLYTKEAMERLFTNISPRFKERNGGYTRILKFGNRKGDGAQICLLQLVDYLEIEGKIKSQKTKEKLELAEKKKEEEQQQQPL